MIQRILLVTGILITLIGCVSGDYEETFIKDNVWSVSNREGIDLRIANEQLQLTLAYPQTMFWSTIGRRDLLDGTFQLTGKPIAGDREVAYGIVVQADPPAEQFIYFMVSADGLYTVGRCITSCNEEGQTRLTDPTWIESDVINTGFNITNTLRVEVDGRDAILHINDTPVANIESPVPAESDMGIIMHTFTSSSTVAFDDISFIEAAVEE